MATKFPLLCLHLLVTLCLSHADLGLAAGQTDHYATSARLSKPQPSISHSVAGQTDHYATSARLSKPQPSISHSVAGGWSHRSPRPPGSAAASPRGTI